MEYSDFNRIEESTSTLIGQVSELFSAPVIPKIVVLGLEQEIGIREEDATFLRIFRDILGRALNNLFVIEFSEQVNYRVFYKLCIYYILISLLLSLYNKFIPNANNNFKIRSHQINYRTHEVKESWMSKIRQEFPSLLIDFRMIKDYQDDSLLIEQIIETR